MRVTGNKYLLGCDQNRHNCRGLWAELLKFYEKHGCLVDADQFPRRPDEVAYRKFKAETYVPLSYSGVQGKVMKNPDRAVLPPRFEKAMQREY